MSRSIHTTRRELASLRRQDFADRDSKAKLLRALRSQLRRKHRIKAAVQAERERPAAPLDGTSPAAIRIQMLDASEHVHYPLSPDDICSLLLALPDTATEGISEIQLCLGKEYIDEQSERLEYDKDRRDPLTGRIGYKQLPKIYTGDVLGTYAPWSGTIKLFAYVYEDVALAALPLPFAATTAYLRLHALKTLIHEVAHHHDHTRRVARGRWLADRQPMREQYAETMEHKWTQEVGVPWLKNRFRAEAAALTEWLKMHAGIPIPLGWLAGDPRRTRHHGSVRRSYSLNSGFETFVEELAEKSQPILPSTETQMAFAWDAHYSDEYECCVRILDGILQREPGSIEALGCKVDTLVHLERFDEAWELAERLLAVDPTDYWAWTARGDVITHRRQWPALLEHCAAWEAAVPERSEGDTTRIAFFRAIACCALERWAEMEHWIQAHDGERSPRYKALTRRAVFRRAGKVLPPSEPPA